MDKDLQNNLRDYAWNYFSLHAEQRLKTFHFFVILSTVITGGILTVAKDISNVGYAAPLAFLLSILAFVFWKLDLRNKELIKYGEMLLKILRNFLIYLIKIQNRIYYSYFQMKNGKQIEK